MSTLKRDAFDSHYLEGTENNRIACLILFLFSKGKNGLIIISVTVYNRGEGKGTKMDLLRSHL